MIFRYAQVKSFYAILGLHGAFMNVTPCITENSLMYNGMKKVDDTSLKVV